MIDRGILTDHPGFSGTDYVLEGASVRDRFLIAFILRHDGSLISDWPQAARQAESSPLSGFSALFLSPEEESLGIQEGPCEPLTLRVMIEEPFGADDDDL